MGGKASSPKPPDPNLYAGGFDYLAHSDRTESVAVFTSEKFALDSPCGEEIKRRFGGAKWLANQGIKSGNILPIKYSGRYVYYVIVRKTTYSDVILTDLQQALEKLAIHCTEQNVPKVIFENYIPQGLQRSDFDNAISNAMGGTPWDFHTISK